MRNRDHAQRRAVRQQHRPLEIGRCAAAAAPAGAKQVEVPGDDGASVDRRSGPVAATEVGQRHTFTKRTAPGR